MTATSPSAFLLSAGLHAAVVALLLLLGLAAGRMAKDEPKVFELVAGEGDNYGTNVAPALGVEGGVKLTTPTPPASQPTPPIPAPAPQPAPRPEARPAPKDERIPNFAKQVSRAQKKGEVIGKREAEKERIAEEKRLAEERRRISYAEFQAKHKVASTAPAKSTGAPTVKKLDPEGIRKGVVGGSTENKIGGQGGKALRTDNHDAMAAFHAMFKDRVRKNFEPPPGLADSVNAQVEVISNPDGTFTGARILKSSGSKEFDEAVLSAVRRVKLAPRPDRKKDTITFTFAMSDREER